VFSRAESIALLPRKFSFSAATLRLDGSAGMSDLTSGYPDILYAPVRRPEATAMTLRGALVHGLDQLAAKAASSDRGFKRIF